MLLLRKGVSIPGRFEETHPRPPSRRRSEGGGQSTDLPMSRANVSQGVQEVGPPLASRRQLPWLDT